MLEGVVGRPESIGRVESVILWGPSNAVYRGIALKREKLLLQTCGQS